MKEKIYNYLKLIPKGKVTTLIIYLDYSTFAQVKGVIQRFLRNPNKEKFEIPGCNERISIKFLVWILRWRKNKRNKILNTLSEVKKHDILVFKNRKQLNKWYKKQFDKRIEIFT